MKINTYVKADFEYDFQQRLTTLNMLSFEMSNTSNLKKCNHTSLPEMTPISKILVYGPWTILLDEVFCY